MIARRYEDLVCWQLSHRLQERVMAFTAIGPAFKDFKYCDQIRDAASSAPRNIAEGFGRYQPKVFRNYLQIAAGSLQETRSHLEDGLVRGYLSEAEHLELKRLSLRAFRATVRLASYLRTAKAPGG
jgi:four helix bundle protein